MRYLGIDGCQGGWVVAMIDDDEKLSHLLIPTLNDLPDILPQLALIDIPLAFADQFYRPCEMAAQLLLGPKKRASVFLTPHRSAVFAADYVEANQLNRLHLGKGLSIQSWNIGNKIKEATLFITQRPEFPLFEAHPELCFYYLNNCNPLLSKKSMSEGAADRLRIIAEYDANYLQVITDTITATKRKAVKMDDVIDATILAIRAKSPNIQTAPVNRHIGDRDAILY
jgi:predicted RNase H-like nuclease